MHEAALNYVAGHRTDRKIKVVEVGSRNINGTVRGFFPNADYHGIDLIAGNDVDEVADAVTWKPTTKAHVVVCCEMLEHCEQWRDVIHNAAGWLRKNGQIVITAAGPNRVPHSGIDGGPLRADEFYENIDPAELRQVLKDAGLEDIVIDLTHDDVRATAWAR